MSDGVHDCFVDDDIAFLSIMSVVKLAFPAFAANRRVISHHWHIRLLAIKKN